MKIKHVFMIIIISSFILLSGCTEISNNDEEDKENEISFTEIRISDSPPENFSSINIKFSEVKLFSNETGWISFISEPKIIDLMYLHKNNLTEQLGIKNINVGNYTKLWIVIDNVSGVLLNNSKTVFFEVPSNTLKLQNMFNFRKGNNSITVEINLDDSIFMYGEGEQYKLFPVLSELKINYSNGTAIRFRNNERIMNYANGTEIRIQDQNTLQNMIENRKPSINIVVNGSRNKHFTVDEDEIINFDASETFDIDNDTLSFFWNFDDGTNSTAPIVNHSYSENGTYYVTLTVNDGEFEDTATIIITVRPSSGQGDNGKGIG